jgi:hypothetical protein
MDREIPHNDQAAPTLGPPPVVGHMTVVQTASFGKIGPVSQETDTIRQGYLTHHERIKEVIKHFSYHPGSTIDNIQFPQVHQTLRIGHVDIMVGMIGHGRASPAADLKARACHACINIEITELIKNQRVVPHILEGHVTDVSNKKRPLL